VHLPGAEEDDRDGRSERTGVRYAERERRPKRVTEDRLLATPATESPTPATIAASACGRRMFQTIRSMFETLRAAPGLKRA